MRSPSGALLWEIGWRHRGVLGLILAMTAVGRLLGGAGSSVAADLLRMLSFLLLFGIFLGRIPPRAFVLPISSLRLAAVPMLAGLTSIELLYLLWLGPVSSGEAPGIALNAALLGALLMSSQAAMWTLERLGPLKFIVTGLLAVVAFSISLAESKGRLTVFVAVFTGLVFAGVWRYIANARSGAGRTSFALPALVPQRHRAFASPGAAQFWFEWRSSGIVLPLLMAGVILMVVAPLSWLVRNDGGDTVRLLMGVLISPVVIAMAVGVGFARPTFWSDDLAMPAFVAVRPLDDEDFVAVKVKVAAASAVVSWLLVLAFLGLWLTAWGPRDALSRLGIGVLVILAGMILTWRFLVSRLWSGLAGSRLLFFGSAGVFGVAAIAALVFDGYRLPAWVLGDSARMRVAVALATVAVIAKCGLAAYVWHHVVGHYRRQYLLVWVGATAAVTALAFDLFRFQTLPILLALLAVPLARVGLAASSVARNRHR